MQTNDVLLNIRDYNELRDFKKNVLDGKCVGVIRRLKDDGHIGFDQYTRYYSEAVVFSDIAEQYSMLEEENESLKRHNSELKEKIKSKVSSALREDGELRASQRETIHSSIKNMSFFQLLKFWFT